MDGDEQRKTNRDRDGTRRQEKTGNGNKSGNVKRVQKCVDA